MKVNSPKCFHFIERKFLLIEHESINFWQLHAHCRVAYIKRLFSRATYNIHFKRTFDNNFRTPLSLSLMTIMIKHLIDMASKPFKLLSRLLSRNFPMLFISFGYEKARDIWSRTSHVENRTEKSWKVERHVSSMKNRGNKSFNEFVGNSAALRGERGPNKGYSEGGSERWLCWKGKCLRSIKACLPLNFIHLDLWKWKSWHFGMRMIGNRRNYFVCLIWHYRGRKIIEINTKQVANDEYSSFKILCGNKKWMLETKMISASCLWHFLLI